MNDTLELLRDDPYENVQWGWFLTNLNDKEKDICTASFGYACEYINRFIDKIPVVIFPIIKRLVKDGYDKQISIRSLIDVILDVYEEFSFFSEEHEDMDDDVCEEVVSRIKKEVK